MPEDFQVSESWAAVQGFEGLYEVSSAGRVRSLPRRVPFGSAERLCGGIVLKQGVKPSGYVFVMLCREGSQKCANVHRLVAMAFVEGYFEGAHVNHRDGVKSNNRADNLEWCTAGENNLHSYAKGLRPSGAPKHLVRFGMKNSQAKISDEQVERIRQLDAEGVRGADIARRLGISPSHVCKIKSGQSRPKQVA